MENHTRKSNKNTFPSPEKPQRTKLYAIKNEHIHETHYAGRSIHDNGPSHLENNIHANGYDKYPTETPWTERRFVGTAHVEDFWNYEERKEGEVSPNAVIDKHMRDQYNGSRWERHTVESKDSNIKTISKNKTSENKIVPWSDLAKSTAGEAEPKRVVPLKPERSKKLKGKGARDQSGRNTIYSYLCDETKGPKSEESSGIEKIPAYSSTQTRTPSVMDSAATVPKPDFTANGYVRENKKCNHPPQTFKKQFQNTEDSTYQRHSADDDQVCFEDTSPLSDFPSNVIFSGFEQMTPLYSHVKSQKSREMRQKQSSPTDPSHSLLKSSSLESAKKKPSVTTAWHMLVSHRNSRHRMNLHILML